MKWTEIPAGVINGATQRLLVAFGDDADVIANRINREPAFVSRLARFAKKGGFEPSTSQKLSREIMGKNFFGVEEAIECFGVNPSKQQLVYLAEVPFAESVLKACKNTHVLVAVFPLSILAIRGKVDKKLFYRHDDTWYNRHAFEKGRGKVGWQLVRKAPAENSTNKTWDDQQALLSKEDETPKTQVMVYTIVGHYLFTGERLFEKIWVQCSDLDLGGYRVYVGGFNAKGLRIDRSVDIDRNNYLGLASARKDNLKL